MIGAGAKPRFSSDEAALPLSFSELDLASYEEKHACSSRAPGKDSEPNIQFVAAQTDFGPPKAQDSGLHQCQKGDGRQQKIASFMSECQPEEDNQVYHEYNEHEYNELFGHSVSFVYQHITSHWKLMGCQFSCHRRPNFRQCPPSLSIIYEPTLNLKSSFDVCQKIKLVDNLLFSQ